MNEPSLKDKTAKGLLWGGLNNGVQQLLNLVFGIFLARLLSPDDYGMVGMLSIFALIASALQESGFNAALVNKRVVTHEDYNSVFWFSTSMSLCLYLILFACAPLIARFYEVPELTRLARYSFLSFFAASFGIAPGAYLFRNLMVKQKALSLTLALIVSGCVGVIMAWLGFAYWGIATQTIVYTATVSLCYWYCSHWRPTLAFSFRPIREMLPFSSRLLLTNIFIHINNNLLTVILGKFYSGREVGYFTQANKWNQMGHTFVSGTVNSVAQPILSTLADDPGRQLRAFRKMLRFTAFISFPAMLGLSLIAPQLITVAITDKWLPSAELMRILCVGGAFLPLNTLYSNLLISKGRSGIYLWNTIGMGVAQVATMLCLYPYGIRTMLTVYVAIQIAWLAIWHLFVWREIRLTVSQAARDILPFAVIAAATMMLTAFLTSALTNQVALMAARIAIAAVIYIGVLAILRSATLTESLQYILKRFRRS